MFEPMPKIVMPVGRVTSNGISLLGSCFLLSRIGWFATASHVTQNDDRNLVIIVPKNLNLSEYQDATDLSVNVINAKIIKIDPVHDTAVLAVEADLISTLQIGSLDQISVGSPIALFGYPHAEHGRKVLTMQNAEIGAKVLLNSAGVKTKHAVINIQTRPGQSGSPVFDMRTKNVIGILIGSYAPGNASIIIGGIDPNTLHQTSHAVSTEYLQEMII